MRIHIGDLHGKDKEPFKQGVDQFFQLLYKHHKDDVLIFTGDFLDSSSVHYETVYDYLLGWLLKFKEVHIVSGNHELSRIKGNLLTPMNRFPTIHTYTVPTETEIEGVPYLFLPYLHSLHNMQKYSSYLWKEPKGVCVSHVSPLGKNWGSADEIDLPLIQCAYKFYGHIHEPCDLDSSSSIIGVPMTTRYGEHSWKKRYITLDGENRKDVSIPEFWTYEKIPYGEDVSNPLNIVVVTDAPSIDSVYERYKGYYILEEKIQLKKDSSVSETSYEDMKESFNSMNLVTELQAYNLENPLPTIVMSDAIRRIQEEVVGGTV